MAKTIIMPKFEMTQEEATIIRWLKQEGDVVEKGDAILEVETDKVNMEVEAPAGGILGGLKYGEGDVVPVTVVIGYVLEEGEPVPEEEETAPPAAGPAAAGPRAVSAGDDRTQPAAPTGKVRATPVARRLAAEQDIDLSALEGSGPRGRIQRADVEAAIETQAAPQSAAPPTEPTVVPLEGMRRTIARRMQQSYQQAPHIMFTLDVDMTEAMAYRAFAKQRAPEGRPVSMTAVLVQACAWALKQYPVVNSHFRDDQILMMPEINVGVAVALDTGLIVPVVQRADQKGLVELGTVVADLATRAREERLRPQDVSGGTFTISNLGMFGIDQFTAIINPPEVAILAVGRIAKRFVPGPDDRPVARPMMALTLAVDHRVIDGAVASRFLAALRDALEHPTTLLL